MRLINVMCQLGTKLLRRNDIAATSKRRYDHVIQNYKIFFYRSIDKCPGFCIWMPKSCLLWCNFNVRSLFCVYMVPKCTSHDLRLWINCWWGFICCCCFWFCCSFVYFFLNWVETPGDFTAILRVVIVKCLTTLWMCTLGLAFAFRKDRPFITLVVRVGRLGLLWSYMQTSTEDVQGEPQLPILANQWYQEEQYTVELRWLEPLWDHENLFETEVVRDTEGYYWCHTRDVMEIIVGYLFGVLYFKCMVCVLIRIAS